VQIDTLKDLAEYCYQQWIDKNTTAMPSGAMKWIRENLVAPDMVGQIEEIFVADIKPSEKCYRFLRLTGVIERERLMQLLRKQVLDEIEQEKAQKLRDVDEQWRVKVESQWRSKFNKPDEQAFSFFWFVIIVSIVLSFIVATIGRISDVLSVDAGWRIGLLVGAIAAFGYRRNRASTLTGQFINSTRVGIEAQKRHIQEEIRDRKANIDSDIPHLINKFSVSLKESEDKCKSNKGSMLGTPIADKTNLKYSYAGIAAVIGALMIFTPSVIISIEGNSLITPTTAIKETDLNTLEEAEASPTVVHDTFPFEGGLLGKWTAKEELTAYQSEGNTSVIAFTVRPDEEFTAITSNVHVDKVGIAKVDEDIFPDVGNDSPNKDFFSKRGLKKGDIIGVICYAGEGFCYVWVKGKVGCIGMFWLADDDPKLKKGNWIRHLGKWTLWVKIKNKREEIGWLMIREDGDLEKIKGWSRYD
jgi:hypothetical protein